MQATATINLKKRRRKQTAVLLVIGVLLIAIGLIALFSLSGKAVRYWMNELKIPVENIMDTLFENIDKGYIRNIGCSNWSLGRLRLANEYAKKCVSKK